MTKRWHVAVAALLVGLQLTTLAAAAPATEAEQQSRKYFEKAEAHFRAGLFADALSEYQAGYDLVPLPGFLINIAQCQRRLGDLSQSLITYRKFILVAPDSRFVPEVKKLIEELQALIDDEHKTAANGSSAKSNADVQQEPQLSPPPVARQPVATPRTDLVATPAAPPPQESNTRWWLWGSVAAAVVVGATVAVLALRDPGTTTVSSGSLGTLRR